MKVLKFGGTSVGSVDAFRRVVAILQQTVGQDEQVIAVTSAMSGTTDVLIEAAKAAATGNEQPYRDARNDLLVKHQIVVGQLVLDGVRRAEIGHILDEKLRTFERLCRSIYILGELTPRGLDAVCSLGEQMAAALLAAALRMSNIEAQVVDARELIVTDDTFGAANPIFDLSRQRIREKLLPMIEAGILPVVTGFIAATPEGVTTTLGRGGSDYSAAIIGASLDVDEVQIWTDVDGVMTADPRVVPDARTLPELSYVEAAELAYFGAKVLHPKTILPAIENDIPIRVLNTFNVDGSTTRIVSTPSTERHMVKALTAIPGLALITVEGRGMIGVPGIAARVFSAVAQSKVSVLMISQASSEQSICFVVPTKQQEEIIHALQDALREELARHYIDRVFALPDIAILAVVGAGMKGTPGIAAGVFSALGKQNINVIAIAQGSSEVNISLALAEKDVEEAMRQIHANFGLGNNDSQITE